jgi:hypothetical protein
VNQTASPIEAIITLSWSWIVSVAADNAFNEFGLADANLTYFEDGIPIEFPVGISLGTPPTTAASDASSLGRILFLDPFSVRSVSVIASAAGAAESVVQAVPEPPASILILTGVVLFLAQARRKAKATRADGGGGDGGLRLFSEQLL